MRISLWTFNMMPGDAISNYIRALGYLFDEQHSAQVLCRYFVRGPEDKLVLESFPSALVRVPLLGPHLAAFYIRPSDVIWLNYPHFYEAVPTFRKKHAKTKILDYHGTTPSSFFPVEDPMRPLLAEGEMELSETVSSADFCIAHSNYMASVLKAHGATKVDVVYYPVSLADFTGEKQDRKDLTYLAEFNLYDSYPILLTVGRAVGNKGLDIIVKALKIIKLQFPKAKLLIVGDYVSHPYVYSHIAELTEHLQIRKEVLFTGPSYIPQLAKFYQLADIYVCGSYHEGFCVPLAEAMASNLPIVASNCTAIPETLDGAGVLYEPGDFEDLARSVIGLLSDDSKRLSLVERGRERVAEFSLEKFAARMQQIIGRIET